MRDPARPEATPSGVAGHASRFLACLPAGVLAWFCLRVTELAAAVQAGDAPSRIGWLTVNALALDLINLARYLPLLFLVSLPFLLIRSPRWRLVGLGLAWSLLLLLQAALVQYFLIARVPLGADLFAYAAIYVRKTIIGGFQLSPTLALGTALALGVLWLLLGQCMQSRRLHPRSALVILALSVLCLFLAPPRMGFAGYENEDMHNLKFSKLPYFLDDSYLYFARSSAALPPPVAMSTPEQDASGGLVGFHYLDPNYPFLHSEQTADMLGPHFSHSPSPPNLVLILAEGLGRSFSGPDASLGSFTPALDKLAAHSLYWENFLAVQGRTFAVLPSVFGSLPFGDNGFSKLGERMPAHLTLLSVLKDQGYLLKFYAGFDSDFDNERTFLKRQGIDLLVDRYNFGGPYQKATEWGYADNDLVSRVLDGEVRSNKQPFVTVIKTVTMHTPYKFPNQANYAARFEQRLDQLGIADYRKDRYRAYRDIYTSILYTDDALGRFFEAAKANPAYANTVFILVGDHRLPEIPMDTRIERYHVPLIIFSPLLKAPARIKSVSSHFDIAPSLLAFLAHNYGVKTPKAVTWIGTGLDLEPGFRNIHEFPLKQTKTNLVDFVSGEWFINQDRLYSLNDGMHIEPSYNEQEKARLLARFAGFRRANEQFARTLALMPAPGTEALADYHDEQRRTPPPAVQAAEAILSVREVRAPESAPAGPLEIEADFANTGSTASDTFAPIVVLLDARGVELSESYGQMQRLEAGQNVWLKLQVKAFGLPPGEYFLTVIAAQPKTGKRIGNGRHHIPIRLRG